MYYIGQLSRMLLINVLFRFSPLNLNRWCGVLLLVQWCAKSVNPALICARTYEYAISPYTSFRHLQT